MNLYEHQAKALLGGHGIAIPAGAGATTPEEAAAAARRLGGGAWVVKAQIHAGGRGKAGGVRPARSEEEVKASAQALLGSRLVTPQTGPDGEPVHRVYVEENREVARELYLALLVDRGLGQVGVVAGAEGGERVEAAADAPDRLLNIAIDPESGLDAAAVAAIAAGLGLAAESLAPVVQGLYEAFLANDASLIEINPLGVTADGRPIALDAKMIVDDNALFRHPELERLRDEEEGDPAALEARRHEINYVQLDGTVGCMVTGAGLALATLDLIRQSGGRPADFMDVRPVATRDQVAAGFGLLLANPRIKAILVNAFGGGILRCDTVAEGVAQAARERALAVPVVVRAAGTNKELCKKLLTGQEISVEFVDEIGEATRRVVVLAGDGRA